MLTRAWPRRVVRVALRAAALAVLLLAALVGAFRVVEPSVPAYRAQVAARAGEVLGAPIDISALDLRWRGLRPEVVLSGVRFISADARRALAAGEVRVGLSLRALLRGRLVPARVVLVAPDLTLVTDGEASTAAQVDWRRLFEDRGHRGEIEISDGRLAVVADGGRRRVAFESIHAEIGSDGLDHTLTAEARLAAGGVLDLQATLQVGDGAARSLIVSAHFTDLQAAGTPAGIAQVSADFSWRRRDGGWDAALERLRVSGADGGARDNGALRLAFTAPAADDSAAYWHWQGEDLSIEDFALLAEALPLPPDTAWQRWLARDPRGRIARAELTVRRAADGRSSVAANAVAHGLGLAAAIDSRVPGFSGVSVELDAADDRGRALLSLDGALLHLPQVFRDSLRVDRAELVADWRRVDDAWTVDLPSITAANADVRAQGNGRLSLAPGRRPTLTLSASFVDATLAANHPYLPVNVMAPALVDWLDRAVVGGRARHGTFEYDGAVGGGALATGEATLRAAFEAEGLWVDYAPGWPALRDGAGHIEFTGTGFSAELERGSLAGVALQPTRAAITAFADPSLHIAGGADGDFGVLLRAFQQTPVGGGWLAAARGGGGARLALDLRLPLQRAARTAVAGTLALDGASFELDGFPHPLTGASGVLEIREDGVVTDAVHGALLDEPVTIEARTIRDTHGAASAAEIHFTGALAAPGIERLLGIAVPAVSGRAEWQARLLAPYDDDPKLQLSSDLRGLGVDLPAPVGKTADAAMPLRVSARIGGDGTRTVSVDGGHALRGRLEFGTADGAWSLQRGRLHLGDGAVGPMPGAGLALGGHLASWSYGRGAQPPVFGGVGRIPIETIELEVGALTLHDRPFGQVAVAARRMADGWNWLFDGASLAGRLDVPDAATVATPLRAQFDRIVIPPRRAAPASATAGLTALAVPPLVFHVGRLQAGPVDLGEVNGLLRPVENGVALDAFTATRREARIAADGSWHTVDGHHRTVLRATIDSTDLRETLAALGYAASMEASAAHLQVDLNWLGSPVQDPRPMLNGEIAVRIERGNLLDVDAGAGRVFGLLSLYALPRRLALDFSDVFRRGLSFDRITGTFAIADGQAHTGDLELRGPAVQVEVTGRTGLATRDYDQQATVTANLASSLTLAGALVGGPGVGAAMLIASEIFKRPLDEIARVRYHMSGSWDEPRLERLDPPAR